MQRPEGSTAPALAFDTTNVVAPQTEGGPAVEPSPIAANKQGEASKGETLALGPAAKEPNAGMEIASADATAGQPTSASSESPAEISSQPQQPASESPSVGGESTTTAAQTIGAETPQASSASNEQNNQQVPVQTSPSEKSAAAPAPANVSATATAGIASRRLAIVGGLLFAAIIILAWVIVPVVRRHAFNVPRHLRLEPPAPATGGAPVFKPRVASEQTSSVQDNGFVGGPRQVSVELKPWKASLRHSAVPTRKLTGAFDRLKERRAKASRAPTRREPDRELAPVAEPDFESAVGPVVEQTPKMPQPAIPQRAELVRASATSEFAEVSAIVPQQPNEISQDGEEVASYMQEPTEFFGDAKESVLPAEEPSEEMLTGAEFAWPAVEPAAPNAFGAVEPIAQEQPHEIIATATQFPLGEATTESVSDFPSAISTEPVFPQTTTPATMPETTQTPTAPISKAPVPPVAKPQPPAATMQTSVQLTFSFEIAAMQLTPSFKMGVLKVRPISKLVTMRLPSPQRAQTALNLQVAFEIVKIQPVAGALGTIRVVPSQQQRPTLTGMPSFAVAGLQLVPNSETAPVQVTPSPQGRASVFITVPFQISTLEFSPSLEIASVILNSNSKQVVVQLPGVGPGPAEGAPMFEIANLELSESGDIAMVQLNLLGGPKRA